jgi:hypothetical protein
MAQFYTTNGSSRQHNLDKMNILSIDRNEKVASPLTSEWQD